MDVHCALIVCVLLLFNCINPRGKKQQGKEGTRMLDQRRITDPLHVRLDILFHQSAERS